MTNNESREAFEAWAGVYYGQNGDGIGQPFPDFAWAAWRNRQPEIDALKAAVVAAGEKMCQQDKENERLKARIAELEKPLLQNARFQDAVVQFAIANGCTPTSIIACYKNTPNGQKMWLENLDEKDAEKVAYWRNENTKLQQRISELEAKARIAHALMQEPSEAMVDAGAKAGLICGGLVYAPAFKAMRGQLLKEVE